jgi:hypothetical protein
MKVSDNKVYSVSEINIKVLNSVQWWKWFTDLKNALLKDREFSINGLFGLVSAGMNVCVGWLHKTETQYKHSLQF